jgi:hypothetical protein
VYELGLGADGQVYFTMRLVKGQDLRAVFELMRDGREGWSRTRVLGVLLKVCEAMAYAHSKGVIQRDLKPANVMVGKFGEVYVMDWGLARVLGREDRHDLRLQPATSESLSAVRTERRESASQTPDSPLITMDGDVVGTPSYMPPEQALGQLASLGPHSDVYSIGAMLYQLVSGEMPYVPRGGKMSPHTILLAVTQGPPKALSELAPQAPAELVAICDKAMAREIPARYGDTSELADDPRAYIEGRVVRAFEAGTWAETRKWVRRNRALAASLAAVLLATTVGAFAFAAKAREATHAAEFASHMAKQESIARGEAESNAKRADEQRRIAEELARAATARRDAIWAIQELAQLNASDDGLDFALNQARPAYEWWLEKAHELVDGVPADPDKGIEGRASLSGHARLLAEIRDDPAPRSEREREWWLTVLEPLVSDLSDLSVVLPQWEASVRSEESRTRWSEAIESIATLPRYGGLRITPQLGLVPRGLNESTGLWEFVNDLWRSSAAHGATASDSEIVWVLVPRAWASPNGDHFLAAEVVWSGVHTCRRELDEPEEAQDERLTTYPSGTIRLGVAISKWNQLGIGSAKLPGATSSEDPETREA